MSSYFESSSLSFGEFFADNKRLRLILAASAAALVLIGSGVALIVYYLMFSPRAGAMVCRCQNGGLCVSGATSFNCSCPTQFTGDHCQTSLNKSASYTTTAANAASCFSPNGGILGNLENNDTVLTCYEGVCHYIQSAGIFVCQCHPGYTGTECQSDIDECGLGMASCTVGCYNTMGSYVCYFRCLSSPCQHGGMCQEYADSFACVCAGGYVGPVCQAVTPDAFWAARSGAFASANPPTALTFDVVVTTSGSNFITSSPPVSLRVPPSTLSSIGVIIYWMYVGVPGDYAFPVDAANVYLSGTITSKKILAINKSLPNLAAVDTVSQQGAVILTPGQWYTMVTLYNITSSPTSNQTFWTGFRLDTIIGRLQYQVIFSVACTFQAFTQVSAPNATTAIQFDIFFLDIGDGWPSVGGPHYNVPQDGLYFLCFSITFGRSTTSTLSQGLVQLTVERPSDSTAQYVALHGIMASCAACQDLASVSTMLRLQAGDIAIMTLTQGYINSIDSEVPKVFFSGFLYSPCCDVPVIAWNIQGNQITINEGGGSIMMASSSFRVTIPVTGVYYVTLSLTGCTIATTEVTLNVNQQPIFTVRPVTVTWAGLSVMSSRQQAAVLLLISGDIITVQSMPASCSVFTSFTGFLLGFYN